MDYMGNIYERRDFFVLPLLYSIIIEIFSSPGELPDFRIPVVWKKGRLYAISKDLEGYPVIKRYRVTWSD